MNKQAIGYGVSAYVVFCAAVVVWNYISINWALPIFLVGTGIGASGFCLSLSASYSRESPFAFAAIARKGQ